LAFVGAVVAGATGAFFSDTETSTGNTFTAGAIDLKIDNESYVTNEAGVLVASPETSWGLDDLTGQLFFNFSDLKPGDVGEDTISIHVNENDAWMCAAAEVTEDGDNTCTEPELSEDGDCQDGDTQNGELGSALNFAFWIDDGDNVLETDEVDSLFAQGPASNLFGESGVVALAEPGMEPIPGDQPVFIGKAWCFGDMSEAALPDKLPDDGDDDSGPLNRGTGVSCDGSQVTNASQTDVLKGNIEFYAEQSRNNPNFTCNGYVPTWDRDQY